MIVRNGIEVAIYSKHEALMRRRPVNANSQHYSVKSQPHIFMKESELINHKEKTNNTYAQFSQVLILCVVCEC